MDGLSAGQISMVKNVAWLLAVAWLGAFSVVGALHHHAPGEADAHGCPVCVFVLYAAALAMGPVVVLVYCCVTGRPQWGVFRPCIRSFFYRCHWRAPPGPYCAQ